LENTYHQTFPTQEKPVRNKSFVKGILIALISLFAAIASSSLASDYYVASTGSDSGGGSISRPWATIQHAVGEAKPGDTIFVRGGIYQEGEIWLRADYGHCGTQGKPVTIKAYPQEIPTFANSQRPFIIQCNDIRIEGLHFKNGKSIGISGIKWSRIQLVNNSFSGAGYAWDAVSISGNNILLEGNVCDIKESSVGTQGHCYYISHGQNIIIRNNIARGMTGYGIHVFDQRRSGDPPDFERIIKDVIIEGNVVTHSLQRSGIILAAYDHARIENVILRNNVLYDNAQCGIYVPGIVRNVKIYNNTLSGNSRAPLAIYGTSQEVSNIEIKNNIFNEMSINGRSTSDPHVANEKNNSSVKLDNNLYWPKPINLHNITDSSQLVGDPQFVDPGKEDYHLRQGSVAINKGLSLMEVPYDKDGVKRPQGSAFDIGAFEYH